MDQTDTTPAGSRRHSFVGMKGDLRCELHYCDLATTSPRLAAMHAYCGREACLYVYKARAPRQGVLLPMCQMWEFTPRTLGKRPSVDEAATAARVARNARNMALALYGIESQPDEFRVLDLLCDFIEELKNHPPETGLDKTLDDFLAECDDDGMEFFVEINGERVIG